MAYLAVEKDDMRALLLTDAVAPVKMRVGGYCAALSSAVFRRSGNTACEKRNAPLLNVMSTLIGHYPCSLAMMAMMIMMMLLPADLISSSEFLLTQIQDALS